MRLSALPSNILTNINSKTPLTWRIFFTDEDAQEEHIATVGKDLQMFDVMNRSYWVVFNDDAQEREYLSMIKSDPRVTAVYPERERQSIFYDEDERTHHGPYVDDIIIHEVRVNLRDCPYKNDHLTCYRTYESTNSRVSAALSPTRPTQSSGKFAAMKWHISSEDQIRDVEIGLSHY